VVPPLRHGFGVALSHEAPAGVVFVKACVGAGLRRHDAPYVARGVPPLDVIPTKAGTHASLNAREVREFRNTS
jgi:hypothetical protein